MAGLEPIIVPTRYLPNVFPKVAHHIQRAIDYGGVSEWDLESLYAALMAGHVFMWVDSPDDPKNALVVKFEQRGGIPGAYIMFLAGEGGMDWPSHLRELAAEWREQIGIERITGHLRKAWLRKFKARPLSTLYEIEV